MIATIVLALIIFSLAGGIVYKKYKQGFFSGCSDCHCSCPAKEEMKEKT